MNRPRLLDLFCGPGGAAVGYHRAGWDVVGVDVAPQPDYPFPFVQGDALTYLARHRYEFDAVHASPPCTEHSTLTRATAGRGDRSGTAGLLAATLAALADLDHGLWVVENVMGAVMPTDLVLCGGMFGLRTYRHRRFTIGPGVPWLVTLDHPRHRAPAARKRRAAAWQAGAMLTVCGVDARAGRQDHALMASALGIDWPVGDGLALVIPPAYTEHIGGMLLDAWQAAA